MSEATRIRIGSWIANPSLNVLENGGRSIRLESRAMDLLVCLAAHPGEVVSLEDLLSAVWKGVVVSDAAVYNTVKQLRQALAGFGDDTQYIETIPKRGYRLVAPVEYVAPPGPAISAAPASAADAELDVSRADPVSRHRLAPWVGAALAVGLLAVAVVVIWQGNDWQPPSQDQRSNAPALRFAIPVEGGVVGLSVSPDGRHLVYAAGPGLDSATLHLRPLDSLVSQVMPDTTGAAFPFWSPRNDEFGFSTLGGIKRLALAGGTPQDVAGTPVRTAGSWNAEDVILFDSSTGIVRVDAEGGQPTHATILDASQGEVAHALPWFLPDGRHFLFVSAFGKPGVHVGALDSDLRRQVLPFSAATAYAAGHILFNRGATLFAQRFNADTLTLQGEPIRVADGLITDPTGSLAIYSASDSVLAYTTGDNVVGEPLPRSSQLSWYDRSGKRLETLGDAGIYRGIELSPDGSMVAVHRHDSPVGGNLWIYDIARGTFTRFTFGSGHDVWPVWSPKGDRLAFTGTDLKMYEKPIDGVGEESLLLGSQRFAFASDWVDDDESLLITHQPKADNDLSALRLDSTPSAVPLLRTKFNEVGGVLSPDGRWLAYASDESGRFEVYVRPYPGLEVKTQLSTAGGILPRWSRDGREVFYLTEQGALLTVPMGGGDKLSPGTPRELFRSDVVILDHWSPIGQLWHMPYDVSPDGQRFLINEFVTTRPSGSPLPPKTTIVVIANWTASLDR